VRLLLHHLAESDQVSVENVLSFGSGPDDVEMIASTGWSVVFNDHDDARQPSPKSRGSHDASRGARDHNAEGTCCGSLSSPRVLVVSDLHLCS
jgi:hypothetical protein